MKLTVATFIASAFVISTPAAYAQGSSGKTPGQEMQEKGSVTGSPGASGYAPGHEMQKNGSKPGTTGASGYAPGRSTTGSGVSKYNDRDDTTRTKSK
jgi:hypothetical protein